jgi:Predicted membrane protein
MFSLETPLWEIVARGSLAYLAVACVLRIIPKRNAGNLAPNDIIALVMIGNLAAAAVLGGSRSIPDILLLLLVVLLWDYAFDLLEYYFPKTRHIIQDSPTVLVRDGMLIRRNLRKEKVTEQELAASLREQGIEDMARVKLAVLEVDGRISVIRKE